VTELNVNKQQAFIKYVTKSWVKKGLKLHYLYRSEEALRAYNKALTLDPDDSDCLNEEERRWFDLYCRLVTVRELVDHVDRLYRDPLYRDDSAHILILRYVTYNFQNQIGDPLDYWG
jgi:hypothetical protein